LSSASLISNSRAVWPSTESLTRRKRRNLIDREMDEAILDDHLSGDERHPFLPIRLDDLIDVDMTPTALPTVDDPEDGLLTDQIGDVPVLPVEPLGAAGPIVGSGRGPGHGPVDEQVQTGLAGVLATTDQEVQVRPIDTERRRGEGAGRVVAAVERVDQAPPEESRDRHLAGQSPPSRSGAEGVSLGDPRLIRLSLEVGDDQVRAIPGRRIGRDPGQEHEAPEA